MCNLAKFKALTAAWTAEEKLKELRQPGNTALVSALLGLTGFEGVLTYKESSFNILNSSKRIVLDELSSSDGLEQAIACSAKKQEDIAENLTNLIDEAQGWLQKLGDVCNATPKYHREKKALSNTRDTLRKVYSATSTNDVETAGDALQDLVDSGLISQESLDQFLNRMNIAPGGERTARLQTVNELRDRYYTVDTGEGISTGGGGNVFAEQMNTSKGQAPPSFTIRDEQGNKVDSITGMSEGSLKDDGTIELQGPPDGPAQNVARTLKIEAEGGIHRPSLSNPTLGMSVTTMVDQLQEELSYEVWACLLMDTVHSTLDIWVSIRAAMQIMIDITLRQQAVLTMGAIGSFTSNMVTGSLQSLGKVQKYVNEIISLSNSAGDTIGIQLHLSTPSMSGGGAGNRICDFNHPKYCEVHRNLLDFSKTIKGDIGLMNFSFGGTSIEDLSFDFNEMMEVVIPLVGNIQEKMDGIEVLLDKLKGDVCAFIAGQMRGMPKSLQELLQALGTIRVLIASIPSVLVDIPVSPALIAEAARLTKVGYTAAAEALMGLDLKRFFSMRDTDATASGQVSLCLREMSDKSTNPSTSARMRELARSAEARSEQQIMGQKIREGIRRRLTINSTSATSARITDEAIYLAKENARG